jgi:hypothetical protein
MISNVYTITPHAKQDVNIDATFLDYGIITPLSNGDFSIEIDEKKRDVFLQAVSDNKKLIKILKNDGNRVPFSYVKQRDFIQKSESNDATVPKSEAKLSSKTRNSNIPVDPDTMRKLEVLVNMYAIGKNVTTQEEMKTLKIDFLRKLIDDSFMNLIDSKGDLQGIKI